MVEGILEFYAISAYKNLSALYYPAYDYIFFGTILLSFFALYKEWAKPKHWGSFLIMIFVLWIPYIQFIPFFAVIGAGIYRLKEHLERKRMLERYERNGYKWESEMTKEEWENRNKR